MDERISSTIAVSIFLILFIEFPLIGYIASYNFIFYDSHISWRISLYSLIIIPLVFFSHEIFMIRQFIEYIITYYIAIIVRLWLQIFWH